jgi:thiamine-monophosphate kinase
MDLSDGLADAVRQVAEASGVGIRLDAGALPIGAGARRWAAEAGVDALQLALAGGDDYELLFTVRSTRRGRLRLVRQQIGELPLTRIGVVTREHDLLVSDAHGARELPSGFEHFR